MANTIQMATNVAIRPKPGSSDVDLVLTVTVARDHLIARTGIELLAIAAIELAQADPAKQGQWHDDAELEPQP